MTDDYSAVSKFSLIGPILLKITTPCKQRAKKVMFDSQGLVDFAVGLVIFVLNLPDGQVLFFWGNSNYRRIVRAINPANQKGFWGYLK